MRPESLLQYLEFPIQPPPPGITPNFVNPDSTAHQVYITAAVCVPLMLGFSVTRFVSKIYLGLKTIRTEEAVFATGLVACIVFIATTIACVSGDAFGRHSWDVPLRAFTKSQIVVIITHKLPGITFALRLTRKLSLIVEIVAPMAICFVKISVLILYLQLFSVIRWMRIASIVGIIAIAAFHVSIAIAFPVFCAPSTGVSYLDFLAAFTSERCVRTRGIIIVQGMGSVVTDVFLMILPLPAIWTLQMPLKRKLALLSMFTVGFCACASSIISLTYRTQYYTAGSDNTSLIIPIWATAIAEEAAGVVICCMPATAALFKSAKKPMLSWFSSVSGRALRLRGSNSSLGRQHEK